MSTDFNPYTAPETQPVNDKPGQRQGYRIIDGKVVVQIGAQLPDVCLRSGAIYGEFSRRQAQIPCTSPLTWLGLLFFPILGFFSFLIVGVISLITTKKIELNYCLLKKYTEHNLFQQILLIVGLLPIIIFSTLSAIPSLREMWDPHHTLSIASISIGSLVALISRVQLWSLRLKKTKEPGHYLLIGVHRDALTYISQNQPND